MLFHDFVYFFRVHLVIVDILSCILNKLSNQCGGPVMWMLCCFCFPAHIDLLHRKLLRVFSRIKVVLLCLLQKQAKTKFRSL